MTPPKDRRDKPRIIRRTVRPCERLVIEVTSRSTVSVRVTDAATVRIKRKAE